MMDIEEPKPQSRGLKSDARESRSRSPAPKRPKTSHPAPSSVEYDVDGLLPPSLAILGITDSKLTETSSATLMKEIHVGISEYVMQDSPPIEAIIKQRFTDFIVNELDQSGNVVHLTNIGNPVLTTTSIKGLPRDSPKEWQPSFNERLRPFFSESSIEGIMKLYAEGAEPPALDPSDDAEAPTSSHNTQSGRGRGQSNRGGRGRGGRGNNRAPDHRQIISEPIVDKEARTACHQLIRELFSSSLDSTSLPAVDGEGAKIVVKWQHGSGRVARNPPYIHFTLQKTNRDTQDALSRIARSLNVQVKDLSVAGTKDKRGVTTQRVSLKRGHLEVGDVWTIVNGLRGGKRSEHEALNDRGERGIRIGNLNYQQSFLELGMLKGNAFVITLRNLNNVPKEALDLAFESLKTRGFINYYGMQRFGTASIPTHAVGLAILQSNWDLVISLLLRPRPGEHPDVEAGRRAWLEEANIDQALALIPRRCVAERSILEHFQRSKNVNPKSALSSIPRNLRLMYVHAYQSYVWNAAVSERIRSNGSQFPVPGDLVFVSADTVSTTEGAGTQTVEGDRTSKPIANVKGSHRGKRPYVAPKVMVLDGETCKTHTIFDVIMPLPGRDVAYPGGAIGDRYREFLKADGLDPDNLIHQEKDYSLLGSYRKILQLPDDLSWKILRYTDPDVPLAQSDEDRLLDFDPPVLSDDGKFRALQVNLHLSTAAYATMALREITRTDTGSQAQAQLTAAAADQAFKGTRVGEDVIEMDDAPEDVEVN